MSSGLNPEPEPGHANADAVQHVMEAHRLLDRLRDKVEEHPELEQAIQKLELALAALTVKSGGML